MDKEMQEGQDQGELVIESKKYFSKKLTREDIYVIVSTIMNYPWIKTDERLRLMYFRNIDGTELKVGLWNETIFDVVNELIGDIRTESFIEGKNCKMNEIKKSLELK